MHIVSQDIGLPSSLHNSSTLNLHIFVTRVSQISIYKKTSHTTNDIFLCVDHGDVTSGNFFQEMPCGYAFGVERAHMTKCHSVAKDTDTINPPTPAMYEYEPPHPNGYITEFSTDVDIDDVFDISIFPGLTILCFADPVARIPP